MTLVYWMVGLRTSVTAYLFAILITLCMSLVGEGFGQTISVLTGDAQLSSALVPLVLVFAFLFAGFFILPDAMPAWLRWGRFLSFMYWGYNALGHNEFDYSDKKTQIIDVILKDFNDLSRWANLGFLLLIAVIIKGAFFLLLVNRKPRFDTTL